MYRCIDYGCWWWYQFWRISTSCGNFHYYAFQLHHYMYVYLYNCYAVVIYGFGLTYVAFQFSRVYACSSHFSMFLEHYLMYIGPHFRERRFNYWLKKQTVIDLGNFFMYLLCRLCVNKLLLKMCHVYPESFYSCLLDSIRSFILFLHTDMVLEDNIRPMCEKCLFLMWLMRGTLRIECSVHQYYIVYIIQHAFIILLYKSIRKQLYLIKYIKFVISLGSVYVY